MNKIFDTMEELLVVWNVERTTKIEQLNECWFGFHSSKGEFVRFEDLDVDELSMEELTVFVEEHNR